MKFIFFCFVVFLFVPHCGAQTGVITTIAGDGYNVDTGDGGPATAAGMYQGGCSAYDTYGNFYISQGANYTIRKISASGIITRYAGIGVRGYTGDGGPASLARLYSPSNLVVDDSGNLYFSEYYIGVIRKIDFRTSIITTIAGNGNNIDSGDGNAATDAAICSATELRFSKNGDLYFGTVANHVRKIDFSTGIISTVAGNGIGGYSGDGGAATDAKIGAFGIWIDSTNKLYIADGQSRIRMVNLTTNVITTFAGGDSTRYNGDSIPATSARLQPLGLYGDKFGNLFAADKYNERIRKIDASGTIFTVAGDGIRGFSGDGHSADSAELSTPFSLAVDSCDNIIFDDNDNVRIRKVTYPAYPTITITDGAADNRLCYGMPVTFTAAVTLPGYAPTYQWRVNGVAVGTSSYTYTYAPANGDSIQCTLTSNLYCVTTPTALSNTLHLVVDSLLVPVITVSCPAHAAIGDTVTCTATVAGTGSGYLLHWKNHNVEFAATTGPTVSYIKTQPTDSITASVASNGRGCYDSAFSNARIVALNTATPQVQPQPAITVYPNPAHDILYVYYPEGLQTLTITNLLGQVVYTTTTVTGLQASIPVSNLPAGIYFVKVNGMWVQRFVVD